MSRTELLAWMEAWRVTPAELARRLGVTRQRVNTLLQRERLSQFMAARVETIMADVHREAQANLSNIPVVTCPLTGASIPVDAEVPA